MFSKKWWGKALERMAKTAAQTLTGMIGADKLLLALPWDFIWQFTATMVLLSFASSILTTPLGPDSHDPSAI